MARDEQPHGQQQMCKSTSPLVVYLKPMLTMLYIAQRPSDGLKQKFSEGAAEEAGSQSVQVIADGTRNVFDQNQNTDDPQAGVEQHMDDVKVMSTFVVTNQVNSWFLSGHVCQVLPMLRLN